MIGCYKAILFLPEKLVLVEVGIDISFSNIFRDTMRAANIIQVMDRLNREAKNNQAELVAYKYNDEPRPYNQLELNESENVLTGASSSIDLYS